MTGLKSIAAKFIAFAVVSIVLLVLLVNTMLNGLGKPSRDFTADFKDVNGLRVGDDVKVAGVRVGRVKSIGVTDHGQQAQVDFQLEKTQPIYRTTTVVMRYQNLVGQRYLELVEPAKDAKNPGAQLAAGTTIPVARTNPGFDLTQLLDGFRPLFQVLQPADVNKLATNIVAVLQGEGGTVDQLLQQTTSLTGFLSSRDQLYGQVLTHLTPVLNNLAGQGGALKSTIVQLESLMKGLARDRQSIGSSIDGVSRLLGTTTNFLERVRGPAVSTVHQFLSVADMLARSRGTLSRAIRSFGVSLGSLGRGASYENALNVYPCEILFAIGNQQIDPAGANGPYSQVCR